MTKIRVSISTKLNYSKLIPQKKETICGELTFDRTRIEKSKWFRIIFLRNKARTAWVGYKAVDRFGKCIGVNGRETATSVMAR